MECGYFYSGLVKIRTPENLKDDLQKIYNEGKELCKNAIEIYKSVFKNKTMLETIADFEKKYEL